MSPEGNYRTSDVPIMHPGARKSNQEKPGEARGSEKQPRRPGSSQEGQGAAREAREQPGAATQQPGNPVSSQGGQGAAMEAKEQPGQPASNQGSHGVTAPCTGQVQDNYKITTRQPIIIVKVRIRNEPNKLYIIICYGAVPPFLQ